MTLSSWASAQVIDEHPDRLQKIDVIEKLGQKIPVDYTFIDENGKSVQLQSYFNDNKPSYDLRLLSLSYALHFCPQCFGRSVKRHSKLRPEKIITW
ncbi:MAG: hypothetical protein R3A45_04555 [Bdellovibrionota bacterium]